jgi:IclR helix-turn-helix domain
MDAGRGGRGGGGQLAAVAKTRSCGVLSARFLFYENKLSYLRAPFRQRSRDEATGVGYPGAVGLSERGVSLGLTAEQVASVIAAATAPGGSDDATLASGLAAPGQLTRSPLLDNRTVSRSLLLGLVVLSSFPADGSDRGIKEVAQELDLPTSTTHRYAHTLHAVGLLEQDHRTRRYRRSTSLQPPSAK